jgi:hypothetical protein
VDCIPFEGDLVASRHGNSAGNRNIVHVAVDVRRGVILYRAVRGRRADVDAPSITLVNIVDPETVNAGVGIGSTKEASQDREKSHVFNHLA